MQTGSKFYANMLMNSPKTVPVMFKSSFYMIQFMKTFSQELFPTS